LRILIAAFALATSLAAGVEGRSGIQALGPKPPPKPKRVVTLAPSVTDIVVAMGHADLVVGVTRYDDAPAVAKATRVGGFLDPSPETIVGLSPDLILWQTDGGAAAVVRRLADLGIPVLALPVISVADTLAASRAVGKVLGDEAGGERLARSLEAAIASARARAKGLPKRRVLFVVGREPLVVAGPGSFPAELLDLLGCENVVRGPHAWPVWPVEEAVAANPDLVIDAAVNEPREALLKLDAVPAIKAGRVARLKNDAALRPGPRLTEALEELLSVLSGVPR
jgi:iron complex transport system substrate-binding protein